MDSIDFLHSIPSSSDGKGLSEKVRAHHNVYLIIVCTWLEKSEMHLQNYKTHDNISFKFFQDRKIKWHMHVYLTN